MTDRRGAAMTWVLAALVLSLALAPAASAGGGSSSLSVDALRVQSLDAPMGIEDPTPRLSWKLTGPGRDRAQRAYQIRVASSPQRLAAGTADLWDSGKVLSDRSIDVPYGGKPLESRRQAHWQVRVWDGDGRVSSWSEPSRWEMGLLAPADWSSSWISHPFTDPTFDGTSWIWHAADAEPVGTVERYFRRTFALPADREIAIAKVLVTADNAVDLHVNGDRVADTRELPPHMTSGWMAGQLVDVSDRLRPGANALGARASNTGTAAGLILRLRIRFADGGTLDIDTDDEWRSSATAADGWASPAFDDGAWPRAKVIGPYGMSPWNDRLRAPRTPIYLRDDFVVQRDVVRARLYSSALGVYRVFVNGRRVGDEEMAPGWTDYAQKVPYQTHDVTNLLRHGDNAIGATVAEGWYGGTLFGGHRYGDSPAFNAQLVVEYADGSVQRVVTGPGWSTGYGAILRSQIYDGEVVDARREQPGWHRAGFDERGWLPAHVRSDVSPRLVVAESPPLRVVRELHPRSVERIAPDTYRFDLGQNFSGRVRLAVAGPAGTRIELRHAERVNGDGTTYFGSLRQAAQVDTFVLRGTGRREVFEPSFTTHGFRYVEVRGFPATPERGDLVGRVITATTPGTGSLSTSDARLDAIQQTIEWGQRSNFTAVPTDCAQRDERLGWTGDVAGYAATATYNADVSRYLGKWLKDLHEAQEPDGAVPSVAPRAYNGANGGEGVSGWGDAIVTVPWTLYERYGDEAVLEEHYQAMEKWIAYLEAHSDGLLRPDIAYGDWLAVEASPRPVINTAYFGYSARLMARIARVLGREADATRYEQLHSAIGERFTDAFVTSDGTIDGDTQAVYVLALQAELLPPALRPAAEQRLLEVIEEHDFHLTTGYLATPFLLDVVTGAGRVDVAYRIAQQETYPGWLYMLRQGATTWWERWNAVTPEGGYAGGSHNHFALGAVGDWMYRTVAGIAPDADAPGYRHSIIHPRPGGGLTHAEGSLETRYGRLSSRWKLSGSVLELEVEVPVNTTATVHVPADDPAKVAASGGAEPVRTGAGFAVYEVGSGRWSFVGHVDGHARPEREQVSVLGTADSVPVLPGEAATATFELYNWADERVTVRPSAAASDGFAARVQEATVTIEPRQSVSLPVEIVRTDPDAAGGTVTLSAGGRSASVALEATDNWARVATMTASSTHTGQPWSPADTNDGRTQAQTDYGLWNSGDGWNDATRGVWPDTFTATWERPVTLGRVRVLTIDAPEQPASGYGLRDYDVEALVGGSWQVVASVRGNTAGTVDSAFEPVTTAALRLKTLDSNDHAYSRVIEFEAYGP
jgi:alpha-L-rhamnosidase